MGLKILQIVTRNEMRGAEVFAGQLADELVARGNDVIQAALYRPLDKDTQPLRLASAGQVELGGRRKGRIETRALWRLQRLVREFRPDIVQANGFHALKYSSILKRLTRARWELVYRNISVASSWIRRSIQRHWGRWIVKPVAVVLSVSDASASDFAQTYGIPRRRVVTLRRGINIPPKPDREEWRRRLCELVQIKPEDPVLFHIGGFTKEKNHVGLLEAFQIIHARTPHARLVLCGDGPLRRSFEESVRDKDLSAHVFCLGNRDDARQLLASADLLLLPSSIEGIPGVVLEAAARCVPSVCTNVGAVREAVVDNVSGMLVPAGAMSQLAEKACQLLNDEQLLRSLADAAQRHVCKMHDMKLAVDLFEQAYRNVLGIKDDSPSIPESVALP